MQLQRGMLHVTFSELKKLFCSDSFIPTDFFIRKDFILI